MPFVHVSDIHMFFNEYGTLGTPPVLLIHGSGATGASEWLPIVDELAKTFHVFAPDLRGHGKTLDPRREYSFQLLANDMAEFIRALKIAPAFVIGHSNGGNVALVMTVEHPNVVKKCVIMAGNAFVSDDLKKYAIGKWSDRVSPEWAKELAKLHDATRYEGYWRELIDRTGREIAQAPNYTRRDLQRVQTPVLAIQGENDTVNAPARHAEFIAENIPRAKLWLAPNTGHSVHEAHPQEWVERVTQFLLTEYQEVDNRQ